LVDRRAGVDSNFRLTPTNRPIIEASCQEVDRLPLALELCAGQIGHEPAEPVRGLVDGALAAVRAVVEPAAFSEAFALGCQLPLEEALATIMLPAPH
jgi:hypothetical protein